MGGTDDDIRDVVEDQLTFDPDPSVQTVVFATNSARRPSAAPACDGLQVRYLAPAEKPLRIAPYQDLPRPGAVAGDQVPTDGVLAYRLRFAFLHYMPELTGVPLGPGLMHRWGELVRPVLFRRADSARAAVISRGQATERN